MSTAQGISGARLGECVRFAWTFPGSGVEALVEGEIREVHHNPEGVTIWLANPSGSGDKTGFTIPAATRIETLED